MEIVDAPDGPNGNSGTNREKGPLVVLVHGWCCHAGFWEWQVAHLAGRYRVATPDLPGHGTRPAVRERWTVGSFSNDVLYEISRRGPGPVLLVGHSLGAGVVLEAAGRLAGRVDALVLVEPFPYDYGHLIPKHVAGLTAPFRRNFREALRKMVRNITSRDTARSTVADIGEAMAATAPEVGLPVFEALLRWDPEPALLGTAAPVYCLFGSRYDRRARERYRPYLRERPIEGGGHFPMVEDPQTFNRVLDEILNEVYGQEPGGDRIPAGSPGTGPGSA